MPYVSAAQRKAVWASKNERKEKEVVNKISKKLNEIVPDSVTPIQALEILYELKRLNKNN